VSRFPILTFHSIDDSGSVISMSPARFRAVMTELAAAGWRGCTVSELVGDGAAPERRFAISFDDGYASVAAVVAPVLSDLGFSATVFAITGRAGGDNAWPGQPEWVPRMPLLDWDGLGGLSERGWEIASHCVDHLPLPTLSDEQVEEQLSRAVAEIGGRLGVEVPLMAYPYGAHDARVRRLVARHHRAALGVRLKVASTADLATRYDIPRVDAYYLRRFPPRLLLHSSLGRGYLSLRRWGRRFRSRDWNAATSPGSADA
jgi:peptidoglycan/xylan/chitin deacetylase (PgdA/CDA1 family)